MKTHDKKCYFLNIFSIYLDRCFSVVCQLFPKIDETGKGSSLFARAEKASRLHRSGRINVNLQLGRKRAARRSKLDDLSVLEPKMRKKRVNEE